LPSAPDLPPAHRRLREVSAPGYAGRKQGEVVRTRTTILQTHTQQWGGNFGNEGLGDSRGELHRAVSVIDAYVKAQSVPLSQAVVRLDGQDGHGAIVADGAGLGDVMGDKDDDLLDLPQVQARLALPPEKPPTHRRPGDLSGTL